MDKTCPECKRPTEVVYDHGTGDTICSECGLVLDNNKNNSHTDPSRVGGNATTESNHHLVKAFERLETMADLLGLGETIKARSYEFYKKIFYEDNLKSCRARNLDAMLAGCLLVACQEEQLPRTLKEVFSVVKDKNATKKEIVKSKSFIIKQLNANTANNSSHNSNSNNSNNNAGGPRGPPYMQSIIKATDLIKRFCSNLGIVDDTVLKAAQEVAAKCEDELDLRRSPISVAATVIYVVVQLLEDGAKAGPGCLKDIVEATNVAEGTIRNTYGDIYPHAIKIVPKWYASENKIKDLLCAPPFGSPFSYNYSFRSGQ
ncbi:hypothetical protein vseg_009037 [Gypsophila vaccaria]